MHLPVVHKWNPRAIEFDQDYTQANCDAEIYLHFTAGFKINSSQRNVTQLIKNLHGLKKGGYDFSEKLRAEPTGPKRNFVQFQSDL